MRKHKGNTLESKDWNRLVDSVKALDNLAVASPLELLNAGNGQMIRYVDNSINAIITGHGSPINPSSSSSSSSSSSRSSSSSSSSSSSLLTDCKRIPYSWVEVQPNLFGQWNTTPQGRSGSVRTNPAYEINGACIPNGTYVKLYPGFNGEYLFSHTCSTSLTSSRSSSSSSSSSSSQSSLSSSSRLSSSHSSISHSSGSVSGWICSCPTMPVVMYATLYNVPDALGNPQFCPCLDGVTIEMPIVFSSPDSYNNVWGGSYTADCVDLHIAVGPCVIFDGGINALLIHEVVNGQPFGGSTFAWNCDPFYIRSARLLIPGVCPGTINIGVDFTE